MVATASNAGRHKLQKANGVSMRTHQRRKILELLQRHEMSMAGKTDAAPFQNI